MTVLEFGAGDLANYGIGWKKREDGSKRAVVIGRLEKPLPFGVIKDNEDRTPIKAEVAFIFENKNGKASLKAIRDALSARLAEWEAEGDG